jgi:hypothetical protein
LAFTLPAGNYLLALGTFANMAFAENNPDADPTLGDGFIGLGYEPIPITTNYS